MKLRTISLSAIILPLLVIWWMVASSSLVIGNFIDRFLPCVQTSDSSFPCQGYYEIYVMTALGFLCLVGIILFITSFLKKS